MAELTLLVCEGGNRTAACRTPSRPPRVSAVVGHVNGALVVAVGVAGWWAISRYTHPVLLRRYTKHDVLSVISRALASPIPLIMMKPQRHGFFQTCFYMRLQSDRHE